MPRPATPGAVGSPIWPWDSQFALPGSAAAAPALLAQPGPACSVKEAPFSLPRRPFFPRAPRARAELLRPGRHPHHRGTHRTRRPTPLPRRPATPSPPPTLPATPPRIPQARPPSPSPGPIWGSWHLLPPRAPTSSGATCTPVRTTRAPRPGSPPIRRRCRTGFPAADTPGPGPIGLEWTARAQGTTDCQSGLGAARVGVGRAPRSRPGVAAWGCRLVPRVSPSRNPVSPCRVETPLRATSYK